MVGGREAGGCSAGREVHRLEPSQCEMWCRPQRTSHQSPSASVSAQESLQCSVNTRADPRDLKMNTW